MLRRILSVLLAMLMLVGTISLFSCKKDEEAESTDSVATSETIAEDEQDQKRRFEVPDNLDYGGKELIVLTYNTYEFGDLKTSQKGIVDQALVNRDSYIENYLNVKLKLIHELGDWYNAQGFSDKVYNNVSTGTHAYDMICAYSMVPSMLTTKGILVDVGSDKFHDGSENYIDYEKEWWLDLFVDTVKVNDKIYSVSGDASTDLLYNMTVVMFDNTELANNHLNASDLYSAVEQGTWTIDYMLQITKNLSRNNDDNWDENDYYAISAVSAIPIEAFYYGANLHKIENKDNRLVASEDNTSERALAVFEKIRNAINFEHTIRYCKDAEISLISNGNCIFEVGTTGQLGNVMSETGRKIGMLPIPKYEEGNNEWYRTLVQNTHAHFCIPIDGSDISMSSAALETMSYASYDIVTPVVYENVMKVRYSVDPDSSRMFDIIREGAITDPAILNQFKFIEHKGDFVFMFRYAVHESGIIDWVSKYRGYEGGINDTLDELNKFYLGV